MKAIRNWATRWVAVVLAASTTTVVGTACGAGQAQSGNAVEREPVVVRTASVEQRVIARPIEAAGTFGPKDEMRLSFKVGGVVEAIAVEPGQTVRAGDALASLDLREIESALQRATSGAAKAQRDLERVRRLYADSVATLSQLQDAETAAEVARADVAAAQFNRRYAVITAPADGTILQRSADPGETVAPAAEILVLGSRQRGGVMRVGLTDRDVVRVRLGDRGRARLDATGEHVYDGVVTQIAGAATPGTGTYEVELTLTNAGSLAAGMVGRVELEPASGELTQVVPVEAVLEADGGKAVVFAIAAGGGRAERREVTVSHLAGGLVAVTSGLEGVVSVVTDGAAWLNDGDAVRVIL